MDLPQATTVGSSAFHLCSALTTVNLPKVDTISSQTFGECTSLTTVNLPKVTTLKNHAFIDAGVRTTLRLPENPPAAERYTFANCAKAYALVLVDADGNELTGDTLAKARKVYDNVTENHNRAGDYLWYDWSVKGSTISVPVTDVSLDKSTLSLEAGRSETLMATVAPAHATNKTVKWTSSNTAIATVTDGRVTAVKEGAATITVTTANGSKTATCAVNVTAATTKPATGGKLEAPLTQEQVNGVFGEGNATLDGNSNPPKITIDSSIIPEKPIEIEIDVTIDLGGSTITGKPGQTPILVGGGNKVTIGGGTVAGGDNASGTGGNGITGGAGSEITIRSGTIVKGGDGATGGDGVASGGNLTIDGTVSGGNGSDGVGTSSRRRSSTTGGNGGNGGNGAAADSTTVNGVATGGNGGNGATGSNGNGGNGGDGVHQESGTVGDHGTAIGGNGGSGAGTGDDGAGGAGVGGGAKPGGNLNVKNGVSPKAEVVGDAKIEVKLPDLAKTVDAVLTPEEKADTTITGVKVTLKVDDKTADKPADAEKAEDIKPANSVIGAFFDITLLKTIKKNDTEQSPEAVTSVPSGNTGSGGSSGGGSSDNREHDFWMTVKEKIQKADSGDVIKVSARTNDKMPVSVMDALRKNDGVSLVITWSGKTITIPAGKAQKNASGRIYWPFSKLAELYTEITEDTVLKPVTGTDPETGGPGKYIPVTGGGELITLEAPAPMIENTLPNSTENALPNSMKNTQTIAPTQPKAVTPPDAGFEPDTFAGTPDNPQQAGGFSAKHLVTIAILLFAGAVGSGVWFWKKRHEEEQPSET